MAKYEKIPHSHITLQFNVEKSAFEHLIGKELEIKIIALCENDEMGLQAFLVEIPKEYKEICINKFPHIALSNRLETIPFKVNEMLESRYFITRLDNDFVCLKGIIEYFGFFS